MTGLEKVTGKIIADAEADARATLAAAQADCEAADAAAAAKTEADCDGLRESAGREGESLIRRAKSAAEMARRDVLLETRSGLVEEAYRQAEKEIRDLPADKYAALLTGSRRHCAASLRTSRKACGCTGRISPLPPMRFCSMPATARPTDSSCWMR